MRLLVVTVLVSIATAGCLTGPDPGTGLGPGVDAALPRILLEAGREVAAGVAWEGKTLEGPKGDDVAQFSSFFLGHEPPSCGARNCQRVPFHLELPAGHWDANAGGLKVLIEWETQDDTYTTNIEYVGAPRLHLDLRVFDERGRLVADGKESGHYGSVAFLERAPPGTYVAQVVSNWGTGSYAGVVAVPSTPRGPDGPVRDLLPDIVMLPPNHLRIEHPLVRDAGPAMNAAGVRGCGPDEVASSLAKRCLRFAGAVGNAGEGAFETHLYVDQAVASLAAPSGHWVQRVFRSDGSNTEQRVGPAHYHAVHGHYHFLGMSQSTVYAYDLETRTRGAMVAQGGKTGFCFIDGGFVDLEGAKAPAPVYFGSGCCYLVGFCQLDLLTYGEIFMGISAGWYDIYPWYRADQYVEVSGIPDGVYELVSVGDPDHRVKESDATNNEASTVFRLTGDHVEQLDPRPY